jgi:hypothetical protein
MLGVSIFWGGDGNTTLAVIAVIIFVILPLIALYQARTFVRKL